jgi:conserved domain protein
MIYISSFRKNDLDPSKGKQIEFNKKVANDFFGFTDAEYKVHFICYSISNPSIRIPINVSLQLSPSRGDYKIYQNSDGSKDLKDFLINDLRLSQEENLEDYFSIVKIKEGEYDFCHIPKDCLFRNFINFKPRSSYVYLNKDKVYETIPPLQVIYYGAPGTGKSYKIKSLDKNGAKPIRTTFHPDSDYSTFVGAYKPTMISNDLGKPNREYSVDELAELLKVSYQSAEKKSVGVDSFVLTYAEQIQGKYGEVSIKELVEKSGLPDGYQAMISDAINLYHYFIKQKQSKETKISYQFIPQAFLKAYVQAWKNYPTPQYLVIEEINRGNCAQIFGDLFQLLDRSSRGFSEYPIVADSDVCKYLCETFADEENFALTDEQRAEINVFYSDEYENVIQGVLSGELLLLPSNLHILATMNTSDQSLFPIDSAFKRRWEWEYVPIRNANKGWVIAVNDKEWDWWTFLERINEKIGSVTESEDKKLGYFFAKPSDNHTISAETFVSKVIFYLWNDVFKDYGFSDKEFLTVDGQQMTFPNFYETEISSQRVNEALVAQFLTNVTGEPLSASSADEDTENNETITDTEEA